MGKKKGQHASVKNRKRSKQKNNRDKKWRKKK